MKFRAGDLEFNATVADASQAASAQTGEMVRSMTIQFRAQQAATHALAVDAARARQAGGLFSLGDAADDAETEWRVRESTFAYVGSEPWGIHHHVWRIEEVERVACERLIVGSIELQPYEYAEQVSEDGILRLAARARVSEADLEAVSRLDSAIALDVVRVGVSSTPRRMVLDGYVWGPSPAGLGIALTCEDLREPRITLNGPAPRPRVNAVADLLAVLREKAVLGEPDLRDLGERVRQRRHAARRVSNIDAWSL